MADLKSAEKEIKETVKKEKEALSKAYGEVLDRLNAEREKIEKDIRNEYKNARKYVSKNPETGVGLALAGGLLMGLIISKLINR